MTLFKVIIFSCPRTPGFLFALVFTDTKTCGCILPGNSRVVDLMHVQPLCLMYKGGALPFRRQLPVTAIALGERQTSGKWPHLSPLSKGLRASCHTFPIPHCEGSAGWQVSIDPFQSCDNWAIKTSERYPACGPDRVARRRGKRLPTPTRSHLFAVPRKYV